MKKMYFIMLVILLTLTTGKSFAQLEKVDTHEPIKTNILVKNGVFLARVDIYENLVNIEFYEKNTAKSVIFGITIKEFIQLGKLLQDYDVTDREMYILHLNGGKLFIRFDEKFGYVQSHIYMDINSEMWFFPILNRTQYKKLFQL